MVEWIWDLGSWKWESVSLEVGIVVLVEILGGEGSGGVGKEDVEVCGASGGCMESGMDGAGDEWEEWGIDETGEGWLEIGIACEGIPLEIKRFDQEMNAYAWEWSRNFAHLALQIQKDLLVSL